MVGGGDLLLSWLGKGKGREGYSVLGREGGEGVEGREGYPCPGQGKGNTIYFINIFLI